MSLLALSWRRRRTQTTSGKEQQHEHDNIAHDSAPSSPLPPAVTASNSGEETTATHGSSSSSHHHIVSSVSSTNSSNNSKNNNGNSKSPQYIKLRLCTAPVTPEGLRPRRLVSVLREELIVPEIAAATIAASSAAVQKQRPFLIKKKKSVSAVLPPAPSSSWSIPNNLHPLLHSQPQQQPQHVPFRVLTSPLISNSSFYSNSNNNNNIHGDNDDHDDDEIKIAESPHLLPGQARTAVGALVALVGRQQQQLESTASSRVTGYDGDGSVEALHSSFQPLPKPTDWMMRCHHDDDDDDDAYEQGEEIPPYYPLDQQQEPVVVNPLLSLSPFRRPDNDRLGGGKNHHHHTMSPISTNSSILMASPSSLARPYLLAKQYAKLASSNNNNNRDDDDVNKSSSSALGLIPRDYQQHQTRYDFGHVSAAAPFPAAPAAAEVGHYTNVVYAHPSDQTHVSAMSNSIPEHGSALYGAAGDHSMSRSVDDDDDTNNDDDEASDLYHQETTRTPHNMDSALLRQKAQNQRRFREELVLAVVERLQDDVQLVADVEAIGHAAVVMADWFVKTPLDRPGILTGFSLQQRKTIVGHLTSVLDEMNVACPEDFFLSPSQVPGFAETHHDLCEALCFCLALVQMAISQEEQGNDEYHCEQGKWKLLSGLRPTLGIIPPDTPEHVRCGGDTSVFTLPSDSEQTPGTSNVSITTTIETNTRNMSSSSLLLRQQFKPNHPNGLQIRRTTEIVSTLVQRMSVACRQLADMPSLQTEKSVRITKDIKNTYLQLIAMDHCDLRALVDAFELELSSSPSRPLLTKLISTDDEEQIHHHHVPGIIPPPNVERKSNARNNSPVPAEFPGASHQSRIDSEQNSSFGTNLFSPCTDDMRSLKPFGQSRHHGNVVAHHYHLSAEFDDLRRGGGHIAAIDSNTSNDHENENVVLVADGGLLQASNNVVDCKFSNDEEEEEEEFDDLRRQYGSNDYENDEEEREGPEESSCRR